MKISLGEAKHIRNELEAFAGPGKPRGCPICANEDDVKVAQVARDAGYTAAQVAAFFIKIRDYSESLMNREVIYRHWYRCGKKKIEQEERRAKEAAKV